MHKLSLGIALCLLLFSKAAMANCAIPNSFSPGTTVSSSQVNNNFTAVANCAAVLNGYISGLQLSTAGSSSTYGIAAGVASDNSAAAWMTLASSFTKSTGSWSLGSGGGSLDTGTIANNSWYHVFLIERPDTGVVDVLVSLSPTSPSLPASYTLFRRIGSMKTDSSAHWVGFAQFGGRFIWSSNLVTAMDVSSPVNTTQSAQTINVPTGITVLAQVRGWFEGPISATTTMLLSSPLEASLTATNGSYPAATAYVVADSTGTNQAFTVDVLTNTNAQVNAVASSGSGSNLVRMTAYGWYDARGAN